MTTGKITVEREPLLAAVSRLRSVCRKSASVPLSGSILVKASDANAWMTLTATTTDCEMSLDVECDIMGGAIEFCVDAERLAQALGAPGESALLRMDGDRLRVAIGKSVFRLPVEAATYFPWMTVDKAAVASFPCEWLPAAVGAVLPFTGSDDLHPNAYTRGVSISADGTSFIRVEGTTGAAAASFTREQKVDAPFTVMVPWRVAEVVAKLPLTRCVVRGGSVLFMGDSIMLTSKTLPAQLPNLDRVFEAGKRWQEIDRKALIEAVKTVAPITELMHKRFKPIHLCPQENGIAFAAVGGASEGRVLVEACESDSEPLEGHFDAAQLLALAGIGEGERVRFCYDTPQALVVRDGAMRAAVTSLRI